jgi:hypothetical protein
MILLTLNIRGVGGTLKQASMRRVFRKVKPDVIMLQETLVDEEKARLFMVKFIPNWDICAINSVGNSGGLLAAWNLENFSLVPFLCGGGINLKGISLVNKHEICILNVYGLCVERKTFWDQVALGGLLDTKNLILA